MKYILFNLLALSILPLLSACEDDIVSAEIDQMFTLAEEFSINRYSIDWTDARIRVNDALQEDGRDKAIRQLLRTLGDRHSYYQQSDGRIINSGLLSCSITLNIPSWPDEIGYIKLTGCCANTDPTTYAESIQQMIRDQDTPEKIGWVVDFTFNGGGNMWPMIAGLGPFYKEEVIGHFIDPDDVTVSWGMMASPQQVQGMLLEL